MRRKDNIAWTSVTAELKSVVLSTVAAAACLLSACTKQEVTPAEEDGDEWISFSTVAPRTKSGAGDTMTDTDEKLRQQPFGIYGYKRLEGSSIQSNVFLSSAAQEVGWGTEGSGTSAKQCWTYSPKRKWETSMHYRFRAYWPYTAEVNPNSDATRLAVEYKSTTQQYDLLVAYATRYPKDEGIGAVKMQFHHALSALRFEVKYKDDSSTKGLTDYVTDFHVKGLYTVGTLLYGYFSSISIDEWSKASADEDPYEKIDWYTSFNTFDSTSELFSWSGERRFHAPANATDTAETATVFDGDRMVLVVPQTISDGNAHLTTANFKLRGAGDALHTVALPTTELLPGKIYTFTLVISSSYITINVNIKDWDTLQSNVDINL